MRRSIKTPTRHDMFADTRFGWCREFKDNDVASIGSVVLLPSECISIRTVWKALDYHHSGKLSRLRDKWPSCRLWKERIVRWSIRHALRIMSLNSHFSIFLRFRLLHILTAQTESTMASTKKSTLPTTAAVMARVFCELSPIAVGIDCEQVEKWVSSLL